MNVPGSLEESLSHKTIYGKSLTNTEHIAADPTWKFFVLWIFSSLLLPSHLKTMGRKLHQIRAESICHQW